MNNKKVADYVYDRFHEMLEMDARNANQVITRFGRGKIYQSFPRLGIEGQRPTDIRIQEYKMNDVLLDNMDVLDIGCNIGFLDLSIADKVGSVTGIDNNECLIDIAQNVASMLNIENATFSSGDFKEWIKNNNAKYDAIFSFAVHYWIGMKPRDYARVVSELNREGGYLFFESQDIEKVDNDFDEYIDGFKDEGYQIQSEGMIKDDGIISRRWLVMKK